MTRPGYVMVEHPIEEAEALLKACECSPLVNEGRVPVRIQRPDRQAVAARDRLQRAVAIERGPSGNSEEPPTVREQAEALLGQRVRVTSRQGGAVTIGKLSHIGLSDTLVLEDSLTTHRVIGMPQVRSVEKAA
jgi:hypothetical protein